MDVKPERKAPAPQVRMTALIAPPRYLTGDRWEEALAHADERIIYRDLCARAGVRARVSSPDLDRTVYLTSRDQSAKNPDDRERLLVAVRARDPAIRALKALEVLAYGFLDYAAREAVCARGYFIPGKPPGRPRLAGAASVAQRVRKYREKQRDRLTRGALANADAGRD